jgi:hypothetical protein
MALFRPRLVRPTTARALAVLPPVLAAACIHIALVGFYLIPFHGDVGVMVCAPKHWLGQGPLEKVHTTVGTDGFDGTYYYIIAQNPLHPQDDFIDLPCYRRARIFYPMASWLLSGGGDPSGLLWVMPLLNLLATCGLAWLGARFAYAHGRSAWWGFLLPLAVNAVMPGLRNLTDSWSAFATMGVMIAWFLRWSSLSLAGWAIMAALTREQNLAIVAALGLAAIMERDWRRVAALGTAVLIAAGWLAYLWAHYGHPPRAPTGLDLPFTGIWYGWTHLGVNDIGQARNPYPHLIRFTILTIQTALCLAIAVRDRRALGLLALVAASLVLVACQPLYVDRWNYPRVLNWTAMVIWLWAVQSGRRWPVVLLAPTALWPIAEVAYIWTIVG